MPNYGDYVYWEQRYEAERIKHGQNYTYDWYFGWSTMETMITNFCCEAKSERVLIVGAGNSTWPEEMYEAGFHNITCIDWSHSVVGSMATRNRRRQGLVYEQADARRMLQFGDGVFDLVLDKACLDAVMCGFDGIKNADLMVQEVHRVLRPGGYYFSMTFGVAEMRLPTLTKGLRWTVEHALVPRHLQHHVFMCQREEDAPPPPAPRLPLPAPAQEPPPAASIEAAAGDGGGAEGGATGGATGDATGGATGDGHSGRGTAEPGPRSGLAGATGDEKVGDGAAAAAAAAGVRQS